MKINECKSFGIEDDFDVMVIFKCSKKEWFDLMVPWVELRQLSYGKHRFADMEIEKIHVDHQNKSVELEFKPIK